MQVLAVCAVILGTNRFPVDPGDPRPSLFLRACFELTELLRLKVRGDPLGGACLTNIRPVTIERRETPTILSTPCWTGSPRLGSRRRTRSRTARGATTTWSSIA